MKRLLFASPPSHQCLIFNKLIKLTDHPTFKKPYIAHQSTHRCHKEHF